MQRCCKKRLPGKETGQHAAGHLHSPAISGHAQPAEVRIDVPIDQLAAEPTTKDTRKAADEDIQSCPTRYSGTSQFGGSSADASASSTTRATKWAAKWEDKIRQG
eukprot:6384509-Amphidinium_carterae.1